MYYERTKSLVLVCVKDKRDLHRQKQNLQVQGSDGFPPLAPKQGLLSLGNEGQGASYCSLPLLNPRVQRWQGLANLRRWLQARMRGNKQTRDGKWQLDKSCFDLSFEPHGSSNYDMVMETCVISILQNIQNLTGTRPWHPSVTGLALRRR